MAIHPTALVSPLAEIAPNVEIGPCAIIEQRVKIASGCRIAAAAQILAGTHLSADCSIGHGAIIGGDPQAVAFDTRIPSGVTIGERCRIREYVTIHRSLSEDGRTLIGPDNYFMAGSHAGHDVTMATHNVIANAALIGGHVVVGSRCFLGGGSTFHQFIRVGDGAITQGNSGFSKDLPPYVIGHSINCIAGLNVVGLKRTGWDAPTRLDIKRAFHLLFGSGLNFKQALDVARGKQWTPAAEILVRFVETRGEKGVCVLRERHD